MVRLPKYNRSEQIIVKEFVARNSDVERSAGRLIIRAADRSSNLDKFDHFFAVIAADALTFEPPIELDREDVEIVQYGGDHYRGTFGMEVTIPEGHIIPQDYTRIAKVEYTL